MLKSLTLLVIAAPAAFADSTDPDPAAAEQSPFTIEIAAGPGYFDWSDKSATGSIDIALGVVAKSRFVFSLRTTGLAIMRDEPINAITIAPSAQVWIGPVWIGAGFGIMDMFRCDGCDHTVGGVTDFRAGVTLGNAPAGFQVAAEVVTLNGLPFEDRPHVFSLLAGYLWR